MNLAIYFVCTGIFIVLSATSFWWSMLIGKDRKIKNFTHF